MNWSLEPILHRLRALMSVTPLPPGVAFAGLTFCIVIGSTATAEPSVPSEAPARAAQEPLLSPDHFYVHFGSGALVFSAGASVKADGVVIPGATVKIDPNVTLITEFGYRWRNFGVSLTGGYPPVATVNGAGSLAPLGPLGRIRYGPTVLSVHYDLPHVGRLKPYVGAGPVFLLIFRNEDGAIQHLDVHDSTGVAVQLGAEFELSPPWSLFTDAKKASLKTNATALLGGAPISADIRLDPLVIAGGFSYRF
jgi:outer membrane protein